MIPLQIADQRARLGHLWRSGAHIGAGDVEVCHKCGIRKSDPRAAGLCAEISKALRVPTPPKHEYDPLEDPMSSVRYQAAPLRAESYAPASFRI